MKKITGLLLLALIAGCTCPFRSSERDLTQYVNPFIGAADNGHTFPGACFPFGLVQPSPDTGNCTWAYCSGYMYLDEKIWGFSQTHLNGTGCPDLGDIQLQPFTGPIERENYHSRYRKETQQAKPGYYAVTLDDFGVDVELTASPRVAFHRYTFKDAAPARLLVDLQYGIVSGKDALRTHILASDVTVEDAMTISGHNQAQAWVKRHYFYVIKFDKPYAAIRQLPAQKGEKAPRYVLDFDLKPGETLQVKVALSTVSVDGAKKNLAAEIPHWNFTKVRAQTKTAWNALLSRAKIEGTLDQKENFYTAMYHLFIQPNNITDVDGRYRGADDKVLTAPDKTYYSTLSLWDTYRAAHPLYTILAPERVNGFVKTMIAHHKAQGYLPIWTLWGKENHCMIGNHSIPVIADAYLKGFRGFNAEAAFDAVKTSLTVNHPKSDWDVYTRYGYLPFDIIKGERLAHAGVCLRRLLPRSSPRRWINTTTRKLSPSGRVLQKPLLPGNRLHARRDSKGNWRTPFDPMKLNHGEHSGYDSPRATPGSTPGMCSTIPKGWSRSWAARPPPPKLNTLFTLPTKTEGAGFVLDVTGLIGQYAHGNEPHHTAYLFNYAGQPWRTQG